MGIFDAMTLPGATPAAPDFQGILRRAQASGQLADQFNPANGTINSTGSYSDPDTGFSVQINPATGGFMFGRQSDNPALGNEMYWDMGADGRVSQAPRYYTNQGMGGLLADGARQLAPVALAALGGTFASGGFGGGLESLGGSGSGSGLGLGAGGGAVDAAAIAGGSSVPIAEQVAFLAANNVSPAAMASILGPEGAAAAGLTGTGLSTAASGGLMNTAQSLLKSITSAGGNIASTISSLIGTPLGKALATAAALAATKTASPASNDPMLNNASSALNGIGASAVNRANANDEEFRRLFMDRYTGMMDRADARDQELYNWNMDRARLASGQMDKFYGAVDAFDNEAHRNKLVGEAMATARQSDSAALAGLSRNMGRMGLNPNSGVWLSNLRQAAQQGALHQTLAANMARTAAEKEGISLRATAAGLKGADSTYAAGALGGSGLGMNAVTAGTSGWNTGNSAWNATTGVGANAFGSIGQWGLSRTNSADQVSIGNTTGRNNLIGYGLGRLWSPN